MKISSAVLTVLILFSVMEAAVIKGRRSTLQIEPRFSFYTDFDETHFGLGGDVIFNPFKRVGVRIEFAELLFNEGTVFFLNHGVLKLMPKIDVLVYLPGRQFQPYIHTGFGLVTGDGTTFLIMGGGLGFDYFMSKKMAFSFEPGLYFSHASDGTSDSDFLLRLTAGAKFAVLP